MKKILLVVDMQKDFVDGSLGSSEAVAMKPSTIAKIKNFEGDIIVTRDTHFDDYMDSSEGKKLPVVHCIKNTEGWELDKDIKEALADKNVTYVDKFSFGSLALPGIVTGLVGRDSFSMEIIGLCTDICVVSNALILKAAFPEIEISIDSACCAGVTPDKHNAALETMRSCQINVY